MATHASMSCMYLPYKHEDAAAAQSLSFPRQRHAETLHTFFSELLQGNITQNTIQHW